MKSIHWLALISLLALSACGGWGDYQHKSDRFGFKFIFPEKWEVWDRSDDNHDYLVATNPAIPGAEISVRAIAVAPDISPNEIYPSYLDGSDYQDFPEFRVENRGAISCANAEGRVMHYQYLGEKARMRGMKVVFLGNRTIIEIRADLPDDDYAVNESELNKMIRVMEL